jgi:hypothetical protein
MDLGAIVGCIDASLPHDLVTQSLEHLVLLHAVDTWPNGAAATVPFIDFPTVTPSRPHQTHAAARAAGGLYEGKLLDEAIRRYECIWLPLLSKHNHGGRVDIIPPLDVAYIWHVHRLDPNYAAFCKEAHGHVFIPKRPFAFSTLPPTIYPQWNRAEPFYPPKIYTRRHTAEWLEKHRPKAAAHLMPRLAEAVKRQASFGHMFLRLCYQDRTYLQLVRPRRPVSFHARCIELQLPGSVALLCVG